MEVGCFRAEEDAQACLVPLFLVDQFMGYVGLIVDDLLVMTIANYFAGTEGIFEFIWYDLDKPEVLRKLGSIVNDVIGGPIACVSSRIYFNILESKK